MRRIHLLSTAAALAVALAAPAALAQRAGGDRAIDEMHRERGSSALPAVPMQNRVAAEADAMGRQDAMRWLSQAEDALRRGQLGQANELMERAETRLLSRSSMSDSVDQPSRSPLIERISAARQALMRRDRNGAMQQLAAARGSLGGSDDMMTGADPRGMAPMQGGQGYGYGPAPQGRPGYGSPGYGSPGYGSPGYGGSTMRDQGMGSSTMSRADAIGPAPRRGGGHDLRLAQGAGGGGGGGAGGGMGEGTGGLQGSTPGSPGVGSLGSTPQQTLGLGQQPAQGAAVPLAPNQGGGRAAPVPGANVEAPGGTGVAPGDRPLRGAPPPGTR